MAEQWSFLVDECVDPDVASQLDSADILAEPVKDALWLGADDDKDILPYARSNDRIVVTSNVSDFRQLDDREHEGVVIVRGHRGIPPLPRWVAFPRRLSNMRTEWTAIAP